MCTLALLQFRRINPVGDFQYFSRIRLPNPFIVKFAIVGEITPPYVKKDVMLS